MDKEILEKLEIYDYVVGVDEVGRGPIAGPVTVSAFAISKENYREVYQVLLGVTDSKKITEKKREQFTELMKGLKKTNKLQVAISSVSAEVIDTKGISFAIQSALNSSVKKISDLSESIFVYLDGSLYADERFDQEVIIKGDSKNWLIGAASVIAKVTRDAQMVKYAEQLPGYGFERHKGYGTKAHYESIQKKGLCKIHRKSWIKNI